MIALKSMILFLNQSKNKEKNLFEINDNMKINKNERKNDSYLRGDEQ